MKRFFISLIAAFLLSSLSSNSWGCKTHFKNLPINIERVREELASLGIRSVYRLDGMIPNAGLQIDIKSDLTSGSKVQSARMEIIAAKTFSNEGELFLGVTDTGVGHTVDEYYDSKSSRGLTPSSPDLLSVKKKRNGKFVYRIREVKSQKMDPALGTRRGRSQLLAGLQALLKRVPYAEVDRVELVYPFDIEVFSEILGKQLEEHRFVLLTDGQPTVFTVNNRRFPVTLRSIAFDRDDRSSLEVSPK